MADLKQMRRRQKELKQKKEGNNSMMYFKADETVRLRALPVGDSNEPAREVVYFYLGQTIKGVISPATFGERCAIMDHFNKLNASKDPDDKTLLSTMKPKQKFVIPVVKYKSLKGGEVDEKNGIKLALLTVGQYQELIDLFLDQEDWGDFSDPKTGYDLKFTRTGKGQFDTEYSTKPCQKGPGPKAFRNTVDIEALLRKEVPSYEETKDKLKQFLGTSSDDDSDDETPKKKVFKKKIGTVKKFKKKTS